MTRREMVYFLRTLRAIYGASCRVIDLVQRGVR
jgi:hypothetical protein